MWSILKRFFVFHFLFPFLKLSFVILHIFNLHFLSSSNPLSWGTNNKIPFLPFIISKDFYGISYLHLFLSFTLCSLFISLQGKEFRILALLINDSLYSCLFFTITGLHFFHLVYGLLLLSLLFWGCSFSYPGQYTFL